MSKLNCADQSNENRTIDSCLHVAAASEQECLNLYSRPLIDLVKETYLRNIKEILMKHPFLRKGHRCKSCPLILHNLILAIKFQAVLAHMRGSMRSSSAFYGTPCRPTEQDAKLSTECHLWDYSFVDGL